MSIIIKNIPKPKLKPTPKPIYSRINVDEITEDMISSLPADFIAFAKSNNCYLPKKENSRGGFETLAAMVNNPYKFFDGRDDTDAFCKKFNIKTKDSIQLFNKKAQDGFKMSGERAKYYIARPYTVSNKKAMRENFKFDGTEAGKNEEINKWKTHIRENYLDESNDKWQLGHKNPETTDNTSANLILQPPIQAKYRDRYIFIDPLTKIPTPSELFKLIKNGNSPFTNAQLRELRDGLIQINLD